MIEESQGNLLEAQVEALVNTVNCVGYMGKGIALQFKQAWPENFRAYEKVCRAGEMKPGRMLVFDTGRVVGPRYLINFPTKRHWKGKSLIEDIEAGLVALVEEVKQLGIRSIAVPPLGCGNGGLAWSAVRPLILRAFESLPDVRVLLYGPAGTPDPRRMLVRTSKPEMTSGRALLTRLIEQYVALAYQITLLEVQKLAYFLQVSGEPLKLQYEQGRYGPFAKNLNHVLVRMEGHYVRGVGDGLKPGQEIELLHGAAEAATAYLSGTPESSSRLKKVADLIDGFETPFSMELLATVHWVATHGDNPPSSAKEVFPIVQSWNPRKRRLFQLHHVQVAWDRLVGLGWIKPPLWGAASTPPLPSPA